MNALHAYGAQIEVARQRLEDRREIRELMAVDAQSGLLHAFLIQWASLSIQLQEPAEQFLVEASRRCADLGESDLAFTLLHIATDAIELYRTLADDTRQLAQLWNARRLPHLDLTSLLTQPSSVAVRRIHLFHEQIVGGIDPWAELAAVFEVQAMLGSVADRVLAQAIEVVGDEIRPALRSVETLARRNRASALTSAMTSFLAAHPERLDAMVATGVATLELYADFLRECYVAGSNLAGWQARLHAS
jgi:hypothetical protein